MEYDRVGKLLLLLTNSFLHVSEGGLLYALINAVADILPQQMLKVIYTSF